MASEREKYDQKSKMNSSIKHIPKDAQVIMSILKELNIAEYEPRVINQLLEFTYSKLVWVCFASEVISIRSLANEYKLAFFF